MMKKFKSALFLLMFPALLCGCVKYNGLSKDGSIPGGGGSQGGDDEGGGSGGGGGGGEGGGGGGEVTPTNVTVYLALTSIGLYQGAKGNNIEAKFLENAIEYTALSGSELPGSDVVTSSNKSAVFVSWFCYEGKGAPTVYTKVPSESGKILYANFTATDEKPDIDGDDDESYVYTLNTQVENGDGNWNVDNAIFYAYMFNNESDSTTVLLSKVSDSYYSFSVSKDHTYKTVVFVRMAAGSSFSWDSKWNQTHDLDFDSSYREAQITSWDVGENKSGVKWVR